MPLLLLLPLLLPLPLRHCLLLLLDLDPLKRRRCSLPVERRMMLALAPS